MVHTQKKRKATAKADSTDIQNAIDDFGQKYHCDSCNKDITHLIIIRCAVCTDFDLCLPCFAAGTEVKDHKKNHSYRVIDVLDFPIFEEDWGADEELLLVEGLELFGIGNWEHIAEHIGTKNKVQVGEHYDRVYVNSDNWPYPDMIEKFDIFEGGKRKHVRGPNYVVPKLAKPPASQPVNHEIAGYMPGRNEFEHVYENEAEQIVKDIEFTEEDTPEDTELKCNVTRIYNEILDEREKRKNFIFERNLTEFRKIQTIEKKRPREEKELFQKYRVFAKMQTAEDFDNFMEDEQRLRSRIAQLQEYLRVGIRTNKESIDYEKEKNSRLSSKHGTYTAAATATDRSTSHLRRSSTKDDLFGSGPSTPRANHDRSIGPQALDIATADGCDLLSNAEQQLCSTLRLYPRAYMAIKDIIIKENATNGIIKRRSIRNMVKIDVNKSSKIFDFMMEMGWINNKQK